MRQPAARATRRSLSAVISGLIVAAAIIAILARLSASSSASSFSGAGAPGAQGDVSRGAGGGAATEKDGAVTEEDGVLLGRVTVFDEYPGVANLDPDLLAALRRAATDAADDSIELDVTSGWRSPDYQRQLLREARSEYGSAAEAARWVATVATSPHVSGEAVDIGPVDATGWLSKHGARYGLCQIYRNEPWHYELRPEAAGRRCPRMYADASDDPRMRQ